MLSSKIEFLLTLLSPQFITDLFLVAIVLIFAFALVAAKNNKFKAFLNYAATLMTSLGILGTFIGIVIGLLAFDTDNIDASLPYLLAGLKTAFITSVFGMGAAIILNSLDALFFSARREEQGLATTQKEVTAEDMYLVMHHQANYLKQIREDFSTYLTTAQSLSSSSEMPSLVDEIKLLRQEFVDLQSKTYQSLEEYKTDFNQHLAGVNEQQEVLNTQITAGLEKISSQLAQASNEPITALLQRLILDFNQQLKTIIQHQKDFETRLFISLDAFASMLSKSATEQIVLALKDVIQDFNKHLVEEFGDNFKALDKSVEKLVTWQEQYKQQVETMGEQYSQSVKSLVTTREAVAGIWEECRAIPRTMESLGEVVRVNQHQIDELKNHLQAFVVMRNKAIEAIPTIDAKLNEMSEALSTSTEALQNNSKQMAVSLSKTAQGLANQTNKTLSGIEQSTQILAEQSEKIISGLQTASEEFSSASSSMNSEIKQSLLNTQEAMNDYVQGTNENVGKVLNTQLQMLEEATARELTTAIEQMSNLLGRVTQHFIQDYQTMVKAMEEVIHSIPRGR